MKYVKTVFPLAAVVSGVLLAGAGGAQADATSCEPTGVNGLTAAQIGGPVNSELDAGGCDIGVYNPDGCHRGCGDPRRDAVRRLRRQRRRRRDGCEGPRHRRDPVQRHAVRRRHLLHERRDRRDQRQHGLRVPEGRHRRQGLGHALP